MISNSTSVSLVTKEKLCPMTHKTRQLFFSLFSQLEAKTSTKLSKLRTKVPRSLTLNTNSFILIKFFYVSRLPSPSSRAQPPVTKKTHPPGADSSSLSSTQKFYCLHPHRLRRGPSQPNSPRRRGSRGHYDSRSGNVLEVTQRRTVACCRWYLTRGVRVLESPAAAPAPCAARGHGTSGGRPVSRSPRESHTVVEEEEEGCPKKCTESNCWGELSTVDAVC